MDTKERTFINTCINQVKISGTVLTDPIKDNEYEGVSYYRFLLISKRNSGVEDVIPIIVDDRELDPEKDIVNCDTIRITGQFRSFNQHGEDGKSHLHMYVYAKNICKQDPSLPHINEIRLCGFITKKPIFRITPVSNLKVCDLTLAINRDNGKSDYAACITWGTTASISKKLKVGDQVRLVGRFQSREYYKQLDVNTAESRTAYEISIGYMDNVNDERNKNRNVALEDIDIKAFRKNKTE